MKRFNTTGPCIPEKHYMADSKERVEKIRMLVDDGAYFTIHQARQYGKTTTLAALARSLTDKYLVVSLDFQRFSQSCFENERSFCLAFAAEFCDEVSRVSDEEGNEAFHKLTQVGRDPGLNLRSLFGMLLQFCRSAGKKAVLMIDEVDSATNNQVFLDFLAQLRNGYLDRDLKGRITFWSVILAGVHDVRHIKGKIRGDEVQKVNSPWNIAADFDVDMSLSEDGIAGMLYEYEKDHQTGMDVSELAGLIYAYTSGYPFLVSRLCKWMNEKNGRMNPDIPESRGWTKEDFQEAVRKVLSEKNPLFDSLTGKLREYPELNRMLKTLLFTGKIISYNPDDPAMDAASMFGFIKNKDGAAVIANRIFETRLYNLYLSSSEMQDEDIYKASLRDKSQFIVDGYLNMKRVLEKFVEHFSDLFHDRDEAFLEEGGRKYFLLYLRPIINGSGNYYIESHTRGLRRTDVIVDYRGEQYIIEMKIWHGKEYHSRGEEQLAGYLDDYHQKKGYLISFNFNRKKTGGGI